MRDSLLAPLPLRFFSDRNAGIPQGRLTGHRPAAGTDIFFVESIYADKEAIVADYPRLVGDRASLLWDRLQQVGRTMHTSTTRSAPGPRRCTFPAEQNIFSPEDTADLVLTSSSAGLLANVGSLLHVRDPSVGVLLHSTPDN